MHAAAHPRASRADGAAPTGRPPRPTTPRPARPEARPWLSLVVRDGLAHAGAEQEQAHDAGALHRPERIGVEVLARELEVRQVEAEMEDRHPHDGDGAQRVEAVETFGGHPPDDI